MFTLKRKISNAACTQGELYHDGELFCYTLERPKVSTAGEPVCIPAGSYLIRMTYSGHFKRNLPEICNVPGRTHILIHMGNKAEDSEGCVLVGLDKGAGWIGHSRDALEKLLKIMGPNESIEILDPA